VGGIRAPQRRLFASVAVNDRSLEQKRLTRCGAGHLFAVLIHYEHRDQVRGEKSAVRPVRVSVYFNASSLLGVGRRNVYVFSSIWTRTSPFLISTQTGNRTAPAELCFQIFHLRVGRIGGNGYRQIDFGEWRIDLRFARIATSIERARCREMGIPEVDAKLAGDLVRNHMGTACQRRHQRLKRQHAFVVTVPGDRLIYHHGVFAGSDIGPRRVRAFRRHRNFHELRHLHARHGVSPVLFPIKGDAIVSGSQWPERPSVS